MADEIPPRRIDKGIKRGPRFRAVKVSDVESRGRELARNEHRLRNERGRLLPSYTPEQRQKAIDDALLSLQMGQRVRDIAERHNLPRSTLEAWLIADGRASEARSLFYASQIAGSLEEMREAVTLNSPLALACARDTRRAWSEIAAVRDSSFAPKQEISHSISITIPVIDVDKLLTKVRGLPGTVTIEGGGINPVEEKDSPPIEATPSSLLSSDSE